MLSHSRLPDDGATLLSERPPTYRLLAVFLLLAADFAFGFAAFFFVVFRLAGFLAIHLFLRELMITHHERV
jgi:hypothetical protein